MPPEMYIPLYNPDQPDVEFNPDVPIVGGKLTLTLVSQLRHIH